MVVQVSTLLALVGMGMVSDRRVEVQCVAMCLGNRLWCYYISLLRVCMVHKICRRLIARCFFCVSPMATVGLFATVFSGWGVGLFPGSCRTQLSSRIIWVVGRFYNLHPLFISLFSY
jgi:hypothetical protein